MPTAIRHDRQRGVSLSYRGGIELRAEDGSSQKISGYGSVFYRGDDPETEYELWPGVRERIMPGAFDRAVKEDSVAALFNHDPNQILGRTDSGTLKLTIDDTGLRYVINPPDNEGGKRVVDAIRRGDVFGSSFGFRITDEDWSRENKTDIRNIRGVELYDVGPVVYPAYGATTSQINGRSAEASQAFRRHALSQNPAAARDALKRNIQTLRAQLTLKEAELCELERRR